MRKILWKMWGRVEKVVRKMWNAYTSNKYKNKFIGKNKRLEYLHKF